VGPRARGREGGREGEREGKTTGVGVKKVKEAGGRVAGVRRARDAMRGKED